MSDYNAMQATVDGLHDENAALKESLDLANVAIEEALDRAERAEAEAKANKDYWRTIRAFWRDELERNTGALRAELEQARAALKSALSRADMYENLSQNRWDTIKDLASKLKQAREENDQLSEEIAARAESNARQYKKRKELEAALESLRAGYDEVEQVLWEYEGNAVKDIKTIAALQGKVNLLESECKYHHITKDVLRGEIEFLKDELTEADARITALQEQTESEHGLQVTVEHYSGKQTVYQDAQKAEYDRYCLISVTNVTGDVEQHADAVTIEVVPGV